LELFFEFHGVASQANATLKDFHLPDDNSALHALFHLVPLSERFQYTKLGLDMQSHFDHLIGAIRGVSQES